MGIKCVECKEGPCRDAEIGIKCLGIAMNWRDKIILSRDRKLMGVATGATYRCRLAGCNGLRVSVLWTDGRRTYPCSRGLVADGDAWRIQ